MAKLSGKTALITGGTTGIGLATAKLFIEEGARVAISGQDQSRVDAAAEEIGADGLAIRADMLSPSDIDAMIAQVKDRFGGLDIVFANAGVAKFAPYAAVDDAMIDELIGVNIKGVFFTIQKAVPIMRDSGAIVVTTSINNRIGTAGASFYAASKAAARSLVRTLAVELADRGIRVNAVSPGPVTTPIFGKVGLTEQQLEDVVDRMKARMPLGRIGRPEEIAKAVLYLAGDDSSFMTGEEVIVDGGLTQG